MFVAMHEQLQLHKCCIVECTITQLQKWCQNHAIRTKFMNARLKSDLFTMLKWYIVTCDVVIILLIARAQFVKNRQKTILEIATISKFQNIFANFKNLNVAKTFLQIRVFQSKMKIEFKFVDFDVDSSILFITIFVFDCATEFELQTQLNRKIKFKRFKNKLSRFNRQICLLIFEKFDTNIFAYNTKKIVFYLRFFKV